MKAVGHQAGQDVLPGARAHQVHGRVPPAQHFQIDGQRLQSRRGYVRARGRREPGQFLSVHRLLLLHDPHLRILRRMRRAFSHIPGKRDLQAPPR